MNYFELFNLPVSLQVNQQQLMQRYIAIQKQHHPDFFSQAVEEEQAAALERSSLANKALKVLQQPDQTLAYVLQLKGLLAEDEKYALPPDFLMEMMELNEKMSEADPETFKEEMKQVELAIQAPISSITKDYDDTTVTKNELLLLKEYYFKKKYLMRILDRMHD